MDVATIISIVQTILSVLQTPQIRDTWSRWGKKADLDGLKSDVIAIKTVLDDAESMDEELLSGQELLYIEKLKDVLYDADDLLDKFVTLANQEQLNRKIIDKVSRFFSRINPFSDASKMCKAVKEIRNKIAGINSRRSEFALDINHKPIRERVETTSVANTQIIGRDDDVEKIVEMLLKDPDVHKDGPSFLTIVGLGGLGKTALAQLVYNNEKIKDEFKLRLWTCVSDHGSSTLDQKTILTKLLESATNEKHDGYSMDVVVRKLQDKLSGKRFLIVLDDLWTEDRDEFLKLVGYLVGGRGSQILVTSRSKETANIVGNSLMYELEGLSSDNSWHLFQLMAFTQPNPNPNVEFIDIGQNIVKSCANVPLAIRVMGSLLYGQDISKWRSVLALGVANIREDRNEIMKILKLSYHNLESPLKSCFSYCALYPKDFEMEKESLISLWIAQGYVVPLEEGQSIEAASEEYFLVLLRRCFFQDLVKDDRGKIYTFKLHDLMHDVALEVAKKEICTPSSFPRDGNQALHHLSLLREKYVEYSFSKAPIRTYLHVDTYYYEEDKKQIKVPPVSTIFANYKCLRALDLCGLGIEILPDSIGKLIHLRYLDLSENRNIKILTESITKLYNLQTLNLDGCWELKELPKDFSKLVNLMVLKISDCDTLACMPLGMGKLTNLSKLSMFVVRERNSSVEHHVDLEELRPLNKLKGSITIVIHHSEKDTFVKDGMVREGGYISDKKHLIRVRFEFRHEDENAGGFDHEEELLGSLQPHVNLEVLKFNGYRGTRMPRWAKEDNLVTFLPNLIQLHLENCPEIQCLPSLEKLNQLSRLKLKNLSNLEYVNNQPTTSSQSESINEEVALEFPCLERLILENLPKLRGWHKRPEERIGGDNSSSSTSNHEPCQRSLYLSKLKSLKVYDCLELILVLQCPILEDLTLRKFNERLRIVNNKPTSFPKLKRVTIDNMAWLHFSLPEDSFQSLTHLSLECDNDVVSLAEFRKVFRACSSSLQTLEIIHCPKLKSVSGVLGNLTALRDLYLYGLPIENLEDEENNGMTWESLGGTLSYLGINGCRKLKSFPKWMQNLTSLRQLDIFQCSSELYKRCENPNGEDWPNIKHIPNIYLTI